MSTSRKFAYNTGSVISGATQYGNLAIGVTLSSYGDNPGGVKWWNGPDEDLGYVIAHTVPSDNQPNPKGLSCSVGFWRTTALTDQSFLTLVSQTVGQTFATASTAATWLNTNGYWTSYSVSQFEEFIFTLGSTVNIPFSVEGRKYDTNGNLLESFRIGTELDIFVDSDNNIYTVSGSVPKSSIGETQSFSTRKWESIIDPSYTNYYTKILSIDHGANVNRIRLDSNRNIYTAGNRTTTDLKTTRKYDSNGNLLWSVDHGGTANGIAVDNNGNVYTVGSRISNLTTRKYDSNGNLLWSVDHGTTVSNIVIDNDGNIYTAGSRSSTDLKTTRKYDSNGNLLWSVDHGSLVVRIDLDINNNLYVCGVRNSIINGVNSTTRKYDSNGNLLWSVDHGNTVSAIGITKNV